MVTSPQYPVRPAETRFTSPRRDPACHSRSMTSPRPALALAALLAAAGVTHFAYPKPYDRMVPTALPGTARTWTYLSGVAELAVAAAVAAPRTRRLGGLAAAALFTAV